MKESKKKKKGRSIEKRNKETKEKERTTKITRKEERRNEKEGKKDNSYSQLTKTQHTVVVSGLRLVSTSVVVFASSVRHQWYSSRQYVISGTLLVNTSSVVLFSSARH